MTSEPHAWQRPPALQIPTASSKTSSNLTVPQDGLLAAGALSPDVQLNNSPPSFIPNFLGTASGASLLKIGNYLLTERLADMTAGVAVYSAVHVKTREIFTCRVSE